MKNREENDKLKISIQGEEGSFHHEAAEKMFGENIEIIKRATFEAVFKDVENDISDFGVVARQNTNGGRIWETATLLDEYARQRIIMRQEIKLKVNQCLIALPNVDISDLKEVHSHPMALKQSKNYLDKLDLKKVQQEDTAASVRMIREMLDPTIAAVGSKRAAEIYGVNVLAEGIENNSENNYTTFAAISKGYKNSLEGDNLEKTKTSVVLNVKNVPGALYKVMNAIGESINLLDINSIKTMQDIVPILIDFEGRLKQPAVMNVFRKIKQLDCFDSIKLLGSYNSEE